jgi:quinol monooxygenase YgiN
MHILVVTFQIKPEKRQAFLNAALEDARASTKNEPGCLRFDVYNDKTDPSKFVFVEAYRDEAAFQEHMKSPHLAKFREATKDASAGPAAAVRCTNLFPPDGEWKK